MKNIKLSNHSTLNCTTPEDSQSLVAALRGIDPSTTFEQGFGVVVFDVGEHIGLRGVFLDDLQDELLAIQKETGTNKFRLVENVGELVGELQSNTLSIKEGSELHVSISVMETNGRSVVHFFASANSFSVEDVEDDVEDDFSEYNTPDVDGHPYENELTSIYDQLDVEIDRTHMFDSLALSYELKHDVSCFSSEEGAEGRSLTACLYLIPTKGGAEPDILFLHNPDGLYAGSSILEYYDGADEYLEKLLSVDTLTGLIENASAGAYGRVEVFNIFDTPKSLDRDMVRMFEESFSGGGGVRDDLLVAQMLGERNKSSLAKTMEHRNTNTLICVNRSGGRYVGFLAYSEDASVEEDGTISGSIQVYTGSGVGEFVARHPTLSVEDLAESCTLLAMMNDARIHVTGDDKSGILGAVTVSTHSINLLSLQMFRSLGLPSYVYRDEVSRILKSSGSTAKLDTGLTLHAINIEGKCILAVDTASGFAVGTDVLGFLINLNSDIDLNYMDYSVQHLASMYDGHHSKLPVRIDTKARILNHVTKEDIDLELGSLDQVLPDHVLGSVHALITKVDSVYKFQSVGLSGDATDLAIMVTDGHIKITAVLTGSALVDAGRDPASLAQGVLTGPQVLEFFKENGIDGRLVTEHLLLNTHGPGISMSILRVDGRKSVRDYFAGRAASGSLGCGNGSCGNAGCGSGGCGSCSNDDKVADPVVVDPSISSEHNVVEFTHPNKK